MDADVRRAPRSKRDERMYHAGRNNNDISGQSFDFLILDIKTDTTLSYDVNLVIRVAMQRWSDAW